MGDKAWRAGCFLVVIFFLCLFSVRIAVSASSSDTIREAERIQRFQQEQARQQFLRDAEERGRAPSFKVSAPVKSPSTQKGVCRDVRQIVMIGADNLPKEIKDQIIASYSNRCLTVTDIEQLLADVLKAYIDIGYISARPYLGAQDISKGKLEIKVVEGKLENILFKGSNRKSINLPGAFPLLKDKPLNIRDFEQGLDQINRLSSNSATMDVLPGAAPGGSVIEISNNATFPIHFSLAYDNLGGLLTGRNQVGATFSSDHPFCINDFLTYTHKETVSDNRHQRHTMLDSVYYSVPIGYWLFSSSYSHSTFLITRGTPGGDYEISGNSHQARGQVDYTFYRDQRDKLGVSFALDYKTSKSFEGDEIIEQPSFALTVFEFDFSWSRTFGSGNALNLMLGYSKGLGLFDALRDNDGISLPATYPHAQGDKLRYSLGLVFPFKEGKVVFSSSLTGQTAVVALMAPQQISVGGFYSVRGFDQVSLTGDRGYYVRNELVANLGKVSDIDNITVSPFIGLDFGFIASYPEQASYLPEVPSGTLIGSAVGVRFNGKHISGDISISRPINAPSFLDLESPRFNALITIKI